MEYILYISRFLYRIRWWLLIGTAIITFAVYYFGKRMIGKTYNVEATLYTGAASGLSLIHIYSFLFRCSNQRNT